MGSHARQLPSLEGNCKEHQQLTWQDPDVILVPHLPGTKSKAEYSASGLSGRSGFVFMLGQCTFINLISTASSSCGVGAATEPLSITYASRSKLEARDVARTVRHAHRGERQRAFSQGTAWHLTHQPGLLRQLVGSRTQG